MKKYLILLLSFCCILSACIPPDEEDNLGGIYGIVSVSDSAEPMRATGVELYTMGGSLLLKTVTYDDGSYEFEELLPDYYYLRVAADGFEEMIYEVLVEPGRIARADMQLIKLNTYMTISTQDVSAIIGNGATLNGMYDYQYNGYGPTEYGFFCGTEYNSLRNKDNRYVTSGASYANGQYHFSYKVSNLARGKYYAMAFATNRVGTIYGEVVSFEIAGEPAVSTLTPSNYSGTTATLNGKIDYEGDPKYSEKGFVYSKSFPNPTIDDESSATTKIVVTGSSADFSANVTGLSNGEEYYVRAYAKNANAVVYGETVKMGGYIILAEDGLMVQLHDLSSGASYYDAERLSDASRIGGFSDWRLPSSGECNSMYSKKSALGFSNTKYWINDYSSYYYYYAYDFSKGTYTTYNSSNTYRVRAVRNI